MTIATLLAKPVIPWGVAVFCYLICRARSWAWSDSRRREHRRPPA